MKNKEALNRLDIGEESNFHFTLRDHKENFRNNSTVRVINPAKNEIGKISKLFYTKSTQEQLKVNQWKNAQNVIEWFIKIEEKSNHKFIVFNIKDFCPPIKETLLIKAINFAEKRVNITNEDKVIIKPARNLFYMK